MGIYCLLSFRTYIKNISIEKLTKKDIFFIFSVTYLNIKPQNPLGAVFFSCFNIDFKYLVERRI